MAQQLDKFGQASNPIQGMDGYTIDDIKDIVRDHVESCLAGAGIDVEVIDMAVHGSRLRGNAREDSDLDVVIQYAGDFREDALFNVLNDAVEALQVDGVRIDINPIREEETGTLEAYMARSRVYDENVLAMKKETTQSMSEEQRTAYEAVRGMLETAGVKVEVLTNEQMNELVATTDATLEAKRISEARQRRIEALNNIDKAEALASGKDIKQVRAERLQREQERRDQAKEIYQRVLSNQFDDVTLHLINKYIDAATPENPYGRRISQRVPQEMERSLYAGKRARAIDALFTRISESAVATPGTSMAERRRGAKEKKKELLKGWAIATGNWHSQISDFTNDVTPIASGKDSDVYYSKDGRNVIKFSKGKDDIRFASDIDAVNLFNHVFPSTAYEIIGYGEQTGRFVTILSQPVIDFGKHAPLTEAERVEYMRSLGYEPINKENTAFGDGYFIVSDLQKGNIVRDQAGNIRVLDADVKLHTPDLGGKYVYPDAITDIEDRRLDIPRLMTAYHGSGALFDKFDHAHMGEGEGAQAYGWGSYVTEVEGIGRTYADAKNRTIFKGDVGQKWLSLINDRMAKGENFEAIKQNFLQRAKSMYENAREKYGHNSFTNDYERLAKLREEDLSVRHLYTVDIPQNNGDNYLHWDEPLKDAQIEKIRTYLSENFRRNKLADFDASIAKTKDAPNADLVNAWTRRGENIYKTLSHLVGGDQATSELLSSIGFAGISYPAQYQSGGRDDGKRNYVIFKEDDAKIIGHIQFLKDNSGTVYGAAVNGKIYLNGSALNPETPIHEYTHLWDDMVRRCNPDLWQRGVELMKKTPVWREVLADPSYANIHNNEDEVASEVHSRLSGRDGAKLLTDMAKDKTSAGVVAQLKQWMNDMMATVRDTLAKWTGHDLSRLTAEQFAMMPLRDLSRGINPVPVKINGVVLTDDQKTSLQSGKAILVPSKANPTKQVSVRLNADGKPVVAGRQKAKQQLVANKSMRPRR